MNKVLQEIIDLLDVELIDENLFRGQNHNTEHVFGGQVLAQALASAFRTVNGNQQLHSLHGYFLDFKSHTSLFGNGVFSPP